MSRLWSRLTYANVMATIALFISLGGSSYAVLRVTGKSVVNNSLTGADITDLTSRDIRDHSLLLRDFKRGQLRASSQGAPGPQGNTGAKGDTGAQGVPGPLLHTLGSGQTLFGKYYAFDDPAPAGQFAVDGVSYEFPLPSVPTEHYLAPGAQPTADCPGNAGDPQAAPGQLCVYSTARANVNTSYSGDGMGFDRKDLFGFAVNVVSSGAANPFYDVGTWAVTAP